MLSMLYAVHMHTPGPFTGLSAVFAAKTDLRAAFVAKADLSGALVVWGGAIRD
jgi:hypothetical protein